MPTTSMHFLAPLDLYKDEKPYSLRFEPDETDIPKTNVKLERHDDVYIEDIRGHEQELILASDGFAVMEIHTSLTYDQFMDEQKITDVYLKEVADAIRDFTSAEYVQIFEHTIRKRHPEFPIATGGTYRWNQPTATAHIDSTSDWVRELIGKMNNEEDTEKLLKQRFQCVKYASQPHLKGLRSMTDAESIWMPLKGPVRDWPLAVCDPKSVDPARDVEPADLVYPRYIIETCQLYWSPTHKWRYLSDQQPYEALVFIQSESSPDSMLGDSTYTLAMWEPLAYLLLAVPHSSFPMSGSDTKSEPRESIEVRAILFYVAH